MLWVARDKFGKDTRCWLFRKMPRKSKSGQWWECDFRGPIQISPSDMPIKLKPGEGPVRVKLVVKEGPNANIPV